MSATCQSLRSDLGIVRVTGADARPFLQAQTTQAIADMPVQTMRRAAWLSARGRVRALFDVIADDEAIWLVTAADNCDYLVQQLGLFVLRADVSLGIAADRAVWSICDDSGEWLAAQGLKLGGQAVAPYQGALWLGTGPRCIEVIGTAGQPPPALAGLPACGPERAALEAIALGIAELPAALRERWIPQMLNLDCIDAVSFTKGCYPGQEIVARTTNLGQVKRRLRRFAAADGTRPAPGDAIVTARGEAAGEINRVAATATGFELLAVVSLNAADGPLALAADGRTLEPGPLPYAS